MSLVMGIVNVTPDSFSDGGLYLEKSDAIHHARQLMKEGADVIDIGGESTRPGATPITIEEEISRVLPVISTLTGEVRLSIDTRHEEVARIAVQAGATIINDISASLSKVAAELQVGWIGMHMQGSPETMQNKPEYEDVVNEVCSYLTSRAIEAEKEGVQEIWIDPGIGFGKTTDHNLQLLENIEKLVKTGWPVLIGASRKRFLGEILKRNGMKEDSNTTDDRLEGSIAMATMACQKGAAMIRVHDVAATVQAVKVTKVCRKGTDSA